jgi:YD repeat-containing protein
MPHLFFTANLREQGGDDAQGSASVAGGTTPGATEQGGSRAIHYPNNPADVQGCTVASADGQCIGASNDVSYEYGAAGAPYNRAGRITKVTHQAGSQERYYGKLGEMIKEVDNINFDPSQRFTAEVFVTRYDYDSWGRMKSLTYPDGDIVRYHYDRGGQVNRISGEKGGVSQTYVAAIQYDKFEQRKYIKYGNGVETTYDYDPARRYLEHLTSSGKRSTFQNLSYAFDKVGNILSRTNDVSPIDGIGGYSHQEYGYDSLYRLTSSRGSYQQGADSGKDAYSLHMRYDGIHNIVNKAQVHVRTGSDGVESLIKGTSYTWDYAYEMSRPPSARANPNEK